MKKFSEKNTARKNIAGKEIKLLRINAGLSQGELARALTTATGCVMSRDTISRIENGTRFVFDYELLSFAQYFNASLSELVDSLENYNGMSAQSNLEMTGNN